MVPSESGFAAMVSSTSLICLVSPANYGGRRGVSGTLVVKYIFFICFCLLFFL